MTRWTSLACALALSSTPAAQFVIADGKLPDQGGWSENVDPADIDLDGDWDAAVAEGGDGYQLQNPLYVNQGGLQGGTKGVFLDETALRMPPVTDQSRDLEFVDFDGDGDPDLYVSNDAQSVNQGDRWYANLGGLQGGTLGYYAEETAQRWSGLAGPGSSITPFLLLPSGTFIDWTADADFADLDNDGDLDLVHSSYGGGFGGNTPTRMFLNDGAGVYSEWNPSGHQLTTANIANGDPGLWCEGIQLNQTTDITGARCDVATVAYDLDLGDIDGDFDIDLLLGERDTDPRMFVNRLDGSTLAPAAGMPLFRDVTAAVFPVGHAPGNGHYEQELGDLDGDGDLDLFSLNWEAVSFQFLDSTMVNDGTGLFGSKLVLADSEFDDNQGDFVDYDNDGDLDLYVANFSGQDRLYENDNNGGATFSLNPVPLVPYVGVTMDADAADVDGDGDYDVLAVEAFFGGHVLLENVTQVPDTTAPNLPNIEDIGSATAMPERRPVRVQAYDNVPDYLLRYNLTALSVEVDGVQLADLPAVSSGGQVFRAELPGNLVGTIDYRFVSQDEYGNAGTSPTISVAGTSGAPFQLNYGAGTAGALGGEPTLRSLPVPFAGSTAYLAASSGAPGGTPAVIAVATAASPPIVLPGLLTLNLGGTPLAVISGSLDANGDWVLGADVAASASPGVHVYAQAWVLDPTSAGEAFASSQGLDITIQ